MAEGNIDNMKHSGNKDADKAKVYGITLIGKSETGQNDLSTQKVKTK